MTRRVGVAVAATTTAATLAGYMRAARRDRAAIAADPAWGELRRSLAPDVTCVGQWSEERLVVDRYGPLDAPIVILVHGWTCNARFWTRQIQALRSDAHVIAYDKRGHGRSSRTGSCDYSIEALADDLQRVIDESVPNGRRFVLAGHSLGAMTIVAWAAREHASVDRCAAAALINTGIGNLIPEARIAPLPQAVAGVQAALGGSFLVARGRIPGGPIMHRAVQHIALGATATPGEVAFCSELIRDCAPATRAGCGRTLAGLDIWHALEALEAPTVVVVGEHDRLTPASHGRRIAAQLPASLGVVELPASGHMGPIESDERVTEVIRGLMVGYLTREQNQLSA